MILQINRSIWTGLLEMMWNPHEKIKVIVFHSNSQQWTIFFKSFLSLPKERTIYLDWYQFCFLLNCFVATNVYHKINGGFGLVDVLWYFYKYNIWNIWIICRICLPTSKYDLSLSWRNCCIHFTVNTITFWLRKYKFYQIYFKIKFVPSIDFSLFNALN